MQRILLVVLSIFLSSGEMRFLFAIIFLVEISAVSSAHAEEPAFVFPLIKGYGGVVQVSDAMDLPQKGIKVVFDITVESKPEDVNRGLETVARYLNLNAQAGHSATDVKLTLVLHGGATKCALSDEAYQKHTNVQTNPNLPLVRELKRHGVEILVCGQSLARNKFSFGEVAGELKIAASAMTVNVNKQQAGYANLSIH